MSALEQDRRRIRTLLAELLREPPDRVKADTRLRRLARYDASIARRLAAAVGVELPAAELLSLERVKDLVEAVARQRGLGAGLPAAGQHGGEPSGPLVRPAASERETDTQPPAAATAEKPAPPGSFECSLAYEDARIHAAAVYCSDGRLGEQMDDLLQRGLALPRYDRLACPGGPAALSGRLQSFWESRGVLDQLRFLVRVHGLTRVVLVAHQGCAYYADRLRIPPEQAESEQRKDLELASWAARRIDSALEVQAYFGRIVGQQVRVDPVPLALSPDRS